MSQVTESMVTAQARSANQSQVWADVADKVTFCGGHSQTLAMADAYEGRAAARVKHARRSAPEPIARVGITR